MSNFFSRLKGTVSTLFQIGKGGPQVKSSSGALEARNAADSAYAILRLALPAGDNDGVDRQTFYSVFANPNDTGTYTLGALSDYGATSGSPQSTNEIQYTRVWFPAGEQITKMRTFFTGGVNGSRQIQFAIYDQATPSSVTGTPNSRVATTAANTPPNATTLFYDVNLTATYTVPTAGYYWLAVQCDNATMSFSISVTFRASSIPRREETTVTFALPSTAGATTQPQSAIIYVAAVK